MIPKIDRCPLCGEYPSLHDNPAYDSVACFNPDCQMWGQWIPREEWNTRPLEAGLMVQLVEATDKIDALTKNNI